MIRTVVVSGAFGVGVASWWHLHECAVRRCRRFGRFKHGALRLCPRHEARLPDGPVTLQVVEELERR
ncbi:MAG: hypothetical protein KGL39_42290 [Patescibacteria group bacterium]|nr:hypothetical protein [Patescibacteria group bacterium]